LSAKTALPYGTWPSPIQPEILGLGKRFNDVQWSGDGSCLLWLEERSGKGVIVARDGGDAPRDLTETHRVRGGVGYGGGDFYAAKDFVVFVEKNGRLYRAPIGTGETHPITPEFGSTASPTVSPDGRWVIYVHSYEKKDRLAIVDSEGREWPRILVEGADFYMQPAWHPDGEEIAWVEWNHPQMPWGGTLLKTARWTHAQGILGDPKLLAGGADIPVMQPAFSPDGRWLAVIAGKGEKDSLLLFDLKKGTQKVLIEGAVLMDPAWVQGVRSFGWSHDGRRIFYRLNENGFTSIGSVDVETGAVKKLQTDPYTWIDQISLSPREDALAFIGSSHSVPDRVAVWNGGRLSVQARSGAERLGADEFSTPAPFVWKAKNGDEIRGIYFPPNNPKFEGRGLPPAVIDIHGGPTSQRVASYSGDTAFFTSRGYAYLEVNYRGSSGYGRSYMRALDGKWGERDVEDAVGGAKALCERNLADPARLVIKGGSAGGYTVLNALIRFPNFFRAGICLFGVSNLFTLAAETHKFEERYLDLMVGPLPEAAQKYRDWSPIFHVDQIRDPLAVFQGDEDTVVPPEQSASIAEALERRNIPHLYRLFPGEGHGWRKSETITAYYTEMEKFLRQHLLYA
jgi:dipeptidyl aminopeptidase/acylaminoacyl peptidase